MWTRFYLKWTVVLVWALNQLPGSIGQHTTLSRGLSILSADPQDPALSPALMPVVKVVVVVVMMMFVVEMRMTIPLPGVCGGVQRRRRTPACARPLGGTHG